ncbi:YcaO-like family protein [Streptomyces roseolilacinus]|uniref:YcaO domain-containing protein n=1 Tax=Streptomyces roseolilacinus TaxID=66904 RepID=A0A918EKN3_9ACTN|nr:YcaO-like family protein [Streptomyces roseolilacinus]GGQ07082.1 hypothetical protein GCM10010249_26650 [Streptomyces roseolilacinus]
MTVTSRPDRTRTAAAPPPRLHLPVSTCPTCAALWEGERAHLPGPGADRGTGPRHRAVLHPWCPRHAGTAHRPVPARPGTDAAGGTGTPPPHGPLLGQRVVYDAGLRLWSSDVVMTVPAGTRAHPAVVGGGIAEDPETALAVGWVEALERRCTLRRPRERLRFTRHPGGAPRRSHGSGDDDRPRWWVSARDVRDARASWVPLEHTVVDSQRRGPAPDVRTDSTGMAAHPDKDEALLRGAREHLERAALHAWWTSPGSRRCARHGAAALAWLLDGTQVLRGARVDVWHVRRGDWHVAGCLVLTPGDGGTARAAFGSGAATDVEAAVRSACREAYQMHTAPGISLTRTGGARFGPATGHTEVPGDYGDRFRRAFPADGSCAADGPAATPPGTGPALGGGAGAERPEPHGPAAPGGGRARPEPAPPRPVASVLDALGAPAAYTDCGDPLTDALGLHVVRVVCPGLPRLTAACRSVTGGVRPDFLGV